jgi:hypothetical protein
MITVRFTLTQREFAAAVRGRMLRDRRRWVWSAVLLAVCLVGVVALDPSHWVLLTVDVVVVYALLTFCLGFVSDPIRWWRSRAHLRYEQTMTVADAGVHFQLLDASTQTPWHLWSRLETLPSAYILVHRTGWFPIPKRAFVSRDDEVAFVDLARRHIRVPDRARTSPKAPL